MAIPEGFYGTARVRSSGIIEEIADILKCEVAVVQTVVQIEAGGNGFWWTDPERTLGRPKILFERHKFSDFTDGKWDKSDSDISGPAGGYIGGIAEYSRLWKAMQLDRTAALMSASYGLQQGMGFNHSVMGYATVEDYVEAMCIGEDEQFDAFSNFIVGNNLADELQDKRWLDLAKGYNGRGNAPEYARRLIADYTSRIGVINKGYGDMKSIQALLNLLGYGTLVTDGFYGPLTRSAIERFQREHGIKVTGLANDNTRAALLGVVPTPPAPPADRSEAA
jgi:hypothetical protein